MKKSYNLIIIATLILYSSAIRVFLGGGALTDPDSPVFAAVASSTSKTPQPLRCNSDWTTTTCPKIAVITSAADSEADGNDAYSVDDDVSLSYQHLFIRNGMSPKHISVHIDNYKDTTNINLPSGKLNLNILQQADIVFFNGGDQSKHSRSWLNDDGQPNQLLKAIASRAFSNNLVVVGTSAGTAVMSQTTYGEGSAFGVWYFTNMVGLAQKSVSDGGVDGSGMKDTRNGTSGLQYDQNAGKLPGFGFVPFAMDTHFDARGRFGRLTPVLVDLNQQIGVGVDEATCLDYNNGIGKVIGKNGVFIVNTTNAKKSQQGSYFQIRNVSLHYLTDGDTYDFTQSALTSSKQLIKSPYHNSPTDSSNLLKSYQCTLLVTRLVDQRPFYNIGKTTKPSSFPTTTPTFEMIFYKSGATKGYYKNGKYTAENVFVDYDYLR